MLRMKCQAGVPQCQQMDQIKATGLDWSFMYVSNFSVAKSNDMLLVALPEQLKLDERSQRGSVCLVTYR